MKSTLKGVKLAIIIKCLLNLHIYNFYNFPQPDIALLTFTILT